jgi:predicted hotdog family 3-hydroxylacyl-ACP dehydratase
VGVITDVQHLVRLHASGPGTCHKNAHIRLRNAQRLGAHTGVKMMANAYAVHIGVAI